MHYHVLGCMDGHWVRLMLVCRRWRSICLNHAKLWSFISSGSTSRIRRSTRQLKNPQALPIAVRLQRSAQADLTCHFRLSNGNIPELLDLLRGNNHRIARLHLEGAREHLEKAFSEIGDLPALKDIEVDYKEPWSFEHGEDIDTHNWTLPEAFTGYNNQRLHSLCLRSIQFADAHTITTLNNLTSLELFNNEDRATAILPSLQDVMSLLSRCPRLTTLRLTDYWSENVTETKALSPIPSIKLPHLECLRLSGQINYLTFIIQSLVVSLAASLEFFLQDNSDEQDIRTFIVPLRRILQRPGVPIIRCIHIEPSSTCGHLVVFTEDVPRHTFKHPSMLLNITVHSSTSRSLEKALVKFIHMLPMHPSNNMSLILTTSLFLAHKPLSLTTWKMLWRALPQTKEVSIWPKDGMDAMLQGLLAVMQDGVKGISGRRRRRLASTAPLAPSTLSLQTRIGTRSRSRECCQYLVDSLKKYRDMELVSKPKGVVWDAITIEPTLDVGEISILKEYWAALKDVTKTLTYEGATAESDGLV